MENRRRNNGLGEKLSFPIIAVQDSDPDEFEFGCVTKPGTPSSPADHLFFNGKLLPHGFPLNRPANNFSYSRSTSIKDSLMSSRSNSTDSRSSNCRSARTSTSEASERKILSTGGKVPVKKPVLNPQYNYCSSQRWQFIGPAPVLMHHGSRSVKVEGKELKSRKMENDNNNSYHGKPWFGKKVLRSFVSACKKCHDIETSIE